MAPALIPHQTSRTRLLPLGDEEATTRLNLGEFQSNSCLTLSEARLIINAIIDRRNGANGEDGEGGGEGGAGGLGGLSSASSGAASTEILVKTQDYLDLFARFKSKESVTQVERLLNAHTGLADFERSQLGTLCCGDAEEARTLIPSLTVEKISDQELDTLCKEIQSIRQFPD